MGKLDTFVRVSRERYPSGAEHLVVWLGTDRIGGVEARDGGYVTWMGRKIYATVEEAARAVVRRRMKRSLSEADRFSRALELPVSGDAVDPVPANSLDGPRA